MYLILILFLLPLVIIIAYTIFYVFPFLFFGPPYVKSSDEKTKAIIKMLSPKPGEKIVDLGSGNGKLLFEIAKYGAIAYGYEINPLLVFLTKRKIKKLGLTKKISVERADFFKKDLSKFDAIVIYGITYIMPRLEKKLVSELQPETRIISNYFEFPNLKPKKKHGEIRMYYSSTSTVKSK